MNFKNYINEDIYTEPKFERYLQSFMSQDKIDKFFLNTKFYWKNFKGMVLYRGIDKKFNFDILKVRQDRKPLSTSSWLNEIINKKLKKKYGFDRSDSLFVSMNQHNAGNYGYIYLVYPIGNFKLLWNEDIYDLWDIQVEYFLNIDPETVDQNGVVGKKQQEGLRRIQYLIDNMKTTIPHREFDGEIVVRCDSYYAFKYDKSKMDSEIS